jgi:Predicted membrane protein
MKTPFWISHHTDDQLCRCVRLGGLDVCARCLGLYPTLFLLLALQAILHAPGFSLPDLAVIPLLTLPALFDWALGRFVPQSGSNLRRIISGVLLAAALARSLWLHFTSPLHPLFAAHFVWMLSTAAMTEFVARKKRLAEDEAKANENLPMPLTTEEILAGMSMEDVQPKAQQTKSDAASGMPSAAESASSAAVSDAVGEKQDAGQQGTRS